MLQSEIRTKILTTWRNSSSNKISKTPRPSILKIFRTRLARAPLRTLSLEHTGGPSTELTTQFSNASWAIRMDHLWGLSSLEALRLPAPFIIPGNSVTTLPSGGGLPPKDEASPSVRLPRLHAASRQAAPGHPQETVAATGENQGGRHRGTVGV
ncbi:hypothetical protein P152DRAFT_135371 [Eremomyces bilateralis CBS 781.70]|uniref:Uncharacterized protein n=1 Tax=Eremomyces bilateralis CBS 781.70 TaxID=1392243 RepID=A0A6G1GFN7_9PEZI|nr:uncharacterized protein P152DRAFT_135371 [Eremomyces bilateralis CBS 781.70]KAF1816731.1 hypothetical protein P152DRAFT_135371 [Eremomyces bilateralis CBS 781.70]